MMELTEIINKLEDTSISHVDKTKLVIEAVNLAYKLDIKVNYEINSSYGWLSYTEVFIDDKYIGSLI